MRQRIHPALRRRGEGFVNGAAGGASLLGRCAELLRRSLRIVDGRKRGRKSGRYGMVAHSKTSSLAGFCLTQTLAREPLIGDRPMRMNESV